MKKYLPLFVLCALFLSHHQAVAQKVLTIEWEYTFVGGCSRLPLDIEFLGVVDTATLIIYNNGTYNSQYGNQTWNYTYTKQYQTTGDNFGSIWIAVGYKNDQGLCPGLGAGRACYSGQTRTVNYTMTDPCAWTETTMSFCGFNNFKFRVNVSPQAGTPITQQGTPKGSYCPGEDIIFDVPCNMKGKGMTFYWYAQEGMSSRYIKQTTAETLTVGDGKDYLPPPGVNTYLYLYAYGRFSLSSTQSGSFVYGAKAPTAKVDVKPPQCADGDDWKIDITEANSASGLTDFTVKVFLSGNTSIFPDGTAAFDGPTGKFIKTDVDNGTFTPGVTSFKITIVNTSTQVCETNLGNYALLNTDKIAATEIMGSHKDLTCKDSKNGEFQLDMTHGNGSYTVKLNGTPYAIQPGSPNQPVITAVPGGTYTVDVSDSKCSADPITVKLIEPAEFTADIQVVKALDCFNSKDGELKVNIAGGTGPHDITWSNGQKTVTATGFKKGTHSVVVTDKGCPTLTPTTALAAPDSMIVELTGTPPKCPDGKDGSMKVTDTQNAPGVVTYAWDGGMTGQEILAIGRGTYSITVTSQYGGKTCSSTVSQELKDPPAWTASIKPLLPAQFHGSAISCHGEPDGRLDVVFKNDQGQEVSGENYSWSNSVTGASKTFIDGLVAGNYTVSVRYKGVCEATASYPLLDPPELIATLEPSQLYNGQMISCHNKSDASLKVSVLGGTGGPTAYTYLWYTGETAALRTGLPPGGYSVKVHDANGCLSRDTLTIANPYPVVASIKSHSAYSGFGVTCAGILDGSITAEGEGGTEDFEYAWSNGKNTAAISNLAAGVYTITVSDNNGCSDVISHKVTTPDPLTMSVDLQKKKDVSCFEGGDGVIALQPHGGADKYEYSKDNLIWQPLPEFDSLKKGSYTFYIRDGNDCRSLVGESLIEPEEILIDFQDIEPAYCSDPRGKATSVVKGGVPDYRYEWRVDGETDVVGTAVTLSGVSANIYRLRVIDAHDCPMESTVPITSTDGAKTAFTSVDTKCFDSADGSAEVTITQGDGPFVIKWPGGQPTAQVKQLKRGTYNVLITDGHACTVVQPVEVKSPAALSLGVKTEVPPTCNGNCNGALTLEAGGGVGGYAYQWNNKTDAAQTQLCAAVYPVILSDANGCRLSRDVEVKQPDAIGVRVVKETLATCRDGCDGALAIEATGGNGGYGYMWATGDINTTRDNLCPGSYVVDVVDMKGCTGQGNVVLNNTAPLPLDLGGGVTLCVGQTQVLDAGAGWTRTTWGSNTGLTSGEQRVSVKEPGSYWVDVWSAKGCVARDTFLLATSFDLLKASFMVTDQALVGDTVVMIDISWPMPESIAWDFPLEMKEVLNLGDAVFGQFASAGTYDVNLTAHLGECVDQVTKTITILGGEEDPAGGRLGYETFVKQFELFPNPNDGSFDVGIELAEEGPITLSVWRSENGALVGKLHEEGDHSYNLFFDLRPMSSGLYLLRLDHAKGKEYIRFIVH